MEKPERLSGLEEKNRDLAEVEVDEVFCLVCYIAAKVTADDTVPGWIVLLVELLLDVCSDVLFYVILLQRLSRAVHGVLLHVFGHVGILDDGFAVGHFHSG